MITAMPHIFISYPENNKDIVGNLRGRLKEYGVDTWAYSHDKTLGTATWNEIKNKITKSKVIIIIVSEYTPKAKGQRRELTLALNKITKAKNPSTIFPIVMNGYPFSKLPKQLKHINGTLLSAYNVKSVALEVANTFFPELFKKSKSPKWVYPKPGDWLEVCRLDGYIESYCDIGDKLYFRRISPLGLFECYFPKINGLFWISPKHVKRTEIIDENGQIERQQVPVKYRFMTAWECERKGYEFLFS
jgi:hypothetical protein